MFVDLFSIGMVCKCNNICVRKKKNLQKELIKVSEFTKKTYKWSEKIRKRTY